VDDELIDLIVESAGRLLNALWRKSPAKKVAESPLATDR